MFKIESYVTPILLSYVDKYVKDFKPADAQVSLWGGGVALHNLVLKADVLQQEVALPFTLVSGRIHELLIQVPWTKVMSEPIVVTIDTIECVLSLRPSDAENATAAPPEPSRKSQPLEAPPGYMQALVRRIVNNIALRVHHLIVKYVQDDIVLSLNVKHLAVDSAGPNWEPAFADIDQIEPMIRRLVRLDDLTLCLDKSDADGKIRFFQEPLLYRCQLDFRVRTQLLSAITRRATNLNIQLRSGKLAWSVSNEQVILLIRLLNERPVTADKPVSGSAQKPAAPAAPNTSSGNSSEPTRQESWSEWAWSWLPSLADRETDVEDTPVEPTPLPVSFNAYLDNVSLLFKLMETEANNRKRSRPLLELCAAHAALITNVCAPTSLRVNFAARELTARSQGKCACGYTKYNSPHLEPTIFLQKAPQPSSEQLPWTWPEYLFNDKVELSEINTDENQPAKASMSASMAADGKAGQTTAAGISSTAELTSGPAQTSATAQNSEKDGRESISGIKPEQPEKDRDMFDDLLAAMGPVVTVNYVHERRPSNPLINAYENPPKDFEYSDWVEECSTSVVVEPMDVRVCTDLIHRVMVLVNIFKEHRLLSPHPPRRVLTVEEKDSLSENLPQRCFKVDVRRMRVRLVPFSHSPAELRKQGDILLEVELPNAIVIVLAPLYAHRVCSAACQLPNDEGPLWEGARCHVTLTANGMQARLVNISGTETRPCARSDVSLVTHHLLYKRFFEERNSIMVSYQLRIGELSVCGSSARLHAAAEVPISLILQRRSVPLKHTTLPVDALSDEDAVAIDITLEDLTVRGYLTIEVNTHMASLKSAKITALHEPRDGELKQAWLLSAPDAPTPIPYFRMAVQWCKKKTDTSLDYCGIWTGSLAMAVDPLFISWLAYQPEVKSEASLAAALQNMVPSDATQITLRRRSVAVSGRRGRKSSMSAELVHVRSRSQGSSELSVKKESHKLVQVASKRTLPKETWLSEERMTLLHERLRYLLINVELGLALVYVTLGTASALDCATLRDAMERHASDENNANRVLGICLGRLAISSNSELMGLWDHLRNDGPSNLVDKLSIESFPWKIVWADVSCYTLQVKPASVPGFSEVKGQENAGASGRLKSRLRIPMIATPKTVLELVTTTITISVVTKKIMFKKITLAERTKKMKEGAPGDKREQYFKAGSDFKPSTLRDFLRGPADRLNKKDDVASTHELKAEKYNPDAFDLAPGPVVSLGINLHADTPPVLIRLEQEQVHIVFAALHCFKHITTLLKRPILTVAKDGFSGSGNLEDINITTMRSVSEMEEGPSEDTSEEMIAIYDSMAVQQFPLKTFFWFQWVVSRVTLVLCSETVKLVLAIDDVINTVDIQTEYKQLKIKLSSLSIKHFHRRDDREDDWVMGVLGGRVLEAREPAKAEEDDHFLAITVTHAQIAALPPTWKEELHPKLLELSGGMESIWEVYATLAPLEAVVQPNIVDNLMSLVNEMSPRAFCVLSDNLSSGDMIWPYFYLNAGGIRLLVVGEDTKSFKNVDDTIVLNVGSVTVTPHPENPICRRAVSAGADGTWTAPDGGFEGRQHEVVIKDLSVKTSQFKKIKVLEAASEVAKTSTGAENPAVKWSQKTEILPVVHILYPMELSCILAPALYTNSVLTCGPAVELNLVSDCRLELNITQLVLLKRLGEEFADVIREARLFNVSSRLVSPDENTDVCPYATYLMIDSEPSSAQTVVENVASGSRFSDSGVETTASSSTKPADDMHLRRSLSVVFVDAPDVSQYLEVFVTMGVVDLALNVVDDGTPEVAELLSEYLPPKIKEDSAETQEKQEPEKERKRKQKDVDKLDSNPSITILAREAPTVYSNMKLPKQFDVTVQLIHATLFQPNVYYWKTRTQNTLQLSLFNTTIALGTCDEAGNWRDVLLSTAKGESDPVTGIPPALVTFKLVVPTKISTLTLNPRGYANLDIERPLKVDISTKNMQTLIGILNLLNRDLGEPKKFKNFEDTPFLFKFKKQLFNEGIETISVQTSQISVCGHEGTVGWDNASLQIIASHRPEKNLSANLLMTALLVAAGSAEDTRHVVLQPLMLGVKAKAIWEAWRQAEGGQSALELTLKIGIEFDDVTIDLRPSDLAAISRLWRSVQELVKKHQMLSRVSKSTTLSSSNFPSQTSLTTKKVSLRIFEPELHQPVQPSPIYSEASLNEWTSQKSLLVADSDDSDHYYKDDLRSGAFKILTGGQLPMAYQVVLNGDTVSWRYPHPRAITRIVAYPLPGQDTEIDCVLELYSSMLNRWDPHTYFKLPVGNPLEIPLFVKPPETVFGTLWRFRVCMDPEPTPPPFEFHARRFYPKQEKSQVQEEPDEPHNLKPKSAVSAEQLSGVLRVDSYFSPRLLPRTKAVVRCASLLVHLHNSLPAHTSNAEYLEGYYVSKPLMRTHRVLTVSTRNTAAHALLHSPAGILLLVDTNLSCDVIDSSMGTMEEAIEEFRLQGGMSVKKSLSTARARVITTGIVMAMQVMRLRTLQALALDWKTAYNQYIHESSKDFDAEVLDVTNMSTREVAKVAVQALDGRVCMWVHNSCSTALRVGQEDTDEVVALGSGARLAYRWRSPTAPKRLRFAITGPSTNWHWSPSIPFIAGCHKLRIELQESDNVKNFANVAYLRVNVEHSDSGRYMHLSGMLVLANMLRENLLYKVRSHAMDKQQWYTVTSGELSSETVGRSVLCSGECEMVLKVKFKSHNCWSGDIPLKECPKQNVPWLVKVPMDGDYPYVSVWCRVVRGRADGRILATVWPLYVLYSHLSLDTDVRITTDAIAATEESSPPPPARTQTIPGRGASTHLQAPGTTSARHSLSFQYKEIGRTVTREAVPMHYGVTDTSVFDKRQPVMNIEDVINDIMNWLTRSGQNAEKSWPYSLVKKYWKDKWEPARLQPRSDVSVRYTAVVAGGGCSLEVQLSPVVLLCNASPISLTLRSFDAAPLCMLHAGTAISPPLAIIQKPFYVSIELGRETFVSSQLQVSAEDPGRYGTPPPGHVTLDHATNFTVLCNQKVALLTLYYEIKEQINVLGVASSYVLINRLNFDIMVSALAVPDDIQDLVKLRPKSFKIVPPTKEPSVACGLQMCKFWLRGHWRGGNPAELRAYMCLNLAGEGFSAHNTVPVRLGQPPLRRAVALVKDSQSVPIVVTQMKRDSHWVVVVTEDPCPQFVVHNHTDHMIAVAQPVTRFEEATAQDTEAVLECQGAQWCCSVSPNTAMHYSTPAYCARFPPLTMPPASVASPILTFTKIRVYETENQWCTPAVVADGSQLLQFSGGLTIKLRVSTHPHSTLLELQNVDQNDISASDIRRRLQGAFKVNKPVSKSEDVRASTTSPLLRTSSNKLSKQPETIEHPPQSGTIEHPPQSGTIEHPSESGTIEHSPESETASAALDPEPIDLKQPPPKKETGTWIYKRAGPGLQARSQNNNTGSFPSVSTFKADAHETGAGPGLQAHFQNNNAGSFPSVSTFKADSHETDLDELDEVWNDSERFRCVVASVAVEMASSTDVTPLLALHLDRTVLLVETNNKEIKTTLSIADAQIDNLQYDTGQYDFAVVASTRAAALDAARWPPMWNMFSEGQTFATNADSARLLLKTMHDKWEVVNTKFNELTEVELYLGTLALYVEDAYVKALVELSRMVVPASSQDMSGSEERSLQRPLRLRLLHVHPLDLTLTLHTAARMYIALDQSPLHLSAFKLHDMMTSAERLTHALTVHYLSAAILGAGWVVGGLELLGAPGALAARVGGATGGVRGVASAAAAALLRSLSACAGSLARNLDLLAGDEEHARRAAAARRKPPPSLLAGLMAGITNFAINILGAVGGLAHHPLVGVAVGETESGAAALRRGLLGALTKPLSATADLVAYAGSGLLQQTGWDPVPEPREFRAVIEPRQTAGWERDCVRWIFRLGELTAFAGYEVLVEQTRRQLLLTHKFLVMADPDTERIVEMIDFRYCTLGPYQGEIIQLVVQTRNKPLKLSEISRERLDDDDECLISATAMARVARYTGASGSTTQIEESRVLMLLPQLHQSHALHAALAAALHHNSSAHFPML